MSGYDKNLHAEDLVDLTSEQLDALMRAELEKDEKDSKKILQILRILEERESSDPANDVDVESLWKAYQEDLQKDAFLPNTARKARKPCRWIGRLTAVAAVVCILIAVAPKVAGTENIFEILGRWTKTIFEFFDTSDVTEPPDEYAFKTDHPGLQQIYDAVAEHGVTQPVVPTWVPDGYTLSEARVTKGHLSGKIYARLINEDSYITITFEIYNENRSNQYTKDDDGVEQCELAGVKHYLMPNDDSWQSVWTTENVECGISTDCEKNVLYKIIKSIYKGG